MFDFKFSHLSDEGAKEAAKAAGDFAKAAENVGKNIGTGEPLSRRRLSGRLSPAREQTAFAPSTLQAS